MSVLIVTLAYGSLLELLGDRHGDRARSCRTAALRSRAQACRLTGMPSTFASLVVEPASAAGGCPGGGAAQRHHRQARWLDLPTAIRTRRWRPAPSRCGPRIWPRGAAQLGDVAHVVDAAPAPGTCCRQHLEEPQAEEDDREHRSAKLADDRHAQRAAAASSAGRRVVGTLDHRPAQRGVLAPSRSDGRCSGLRPPVV